MTEVIKSEPTSVVTPATTERPFAPPGNLPAALGAGLVAAAVGAVLWAAITIATKMQIGFMAIGVGFLVGWAVRRFGHGQEAVYGVIGGALALLGCALGNLLSASAFLASAQGRSFGEVLMKVAAAPALAERLMEISFNAMDLLFYAIAVYEGFKLARRPISA